MAGQSGSRTINIKGYNFGVETQVDIRSDDADLVYNTAVQSLEIVSGDVNDDFIPTGTLTLATALANVFATGTVTCLGAQVGDTVTVNGLVYTAISGTKVDNITFDIDGDDTADAVDLADSVNNDVRAGTIGDISAANVAGVVTFTTTVLGVAGDAVTLVSSDGTRMAVDPGAVLENGVSADVATVNGLTYTAVSGAAAEGEFDIDGGTDTLDAIELRNAINNDTRTPITVPAISVTATAAVAVVTINALTGGTAGNTIDTVGTSNITAGAATLVDVDAAGAYTVLVEGLDANYLEISEVINLNGQIANALTNQYLVINKATIITAGTTGGNQGLITLRISGAGATQITIPVLEAQSFSTNYTIPAGFTGEITNIKYGVDLATDTLIRLKARDNTVTDATWQTQLVEGIKDPTSHDYKDQELVFGPRTDLRFTGIRVTGSDDDRITIQYTIVLRPV